MKKNNIKPLVMSALTALAMGAVGTVGTFALFTDKAETTVNIEAGKVDVSTGVTIQKAYSLNAQDATSVTSGTEASYVNGGSASVDGSIVEIKKWTPGDGIKLRTSPVNGSNVNILSRIKISLVGDLAPALEIRVRSAGASDTYDTNVIYGRIGAGQLVSDWVSLAYSETPNNPTAYDIDIVFPDHDNGEIKFGADNKDNQYMDKTATVVIAYEAVQGNADVGANLLERINTTLATESIRDKGYNKTMYDAMADIAEANLADEAAVKAAGYVWSPETDQFYDFSSAPADAYKYFKIADTKAAAGDYSIYASSAWNVSPVSVSGVGFDVGSHTSDIASVSYTGLGETNARTNIIRTNSLDTDVIAYAPYDTVQHYGDAHTVTIHDIANHSYHEFGRVALMDVAKGRVALEAGSDVKNLHFSASKSTETEKTFDAITVAYDESVTLPTFSRDAVQIAAEGTLVVELQNSVDEQKADSDYVWLFQQGLKEQIRITEEVPTEQVAEKVAEAPKSTDNSVKQKTSVAAEQIANNLSGNATYKTYAELQEAGAINTDGSVKNEVLAAHDAIIEDVGVEQNAEAKAAALEEIVEETISVIAIESSDTEHKYVARIGSQFFESFYDAFYAVNDNGKTIRVINNEADVSFVRGFNYEFYLNNGTEPVRDETPNNKYISLPYNNLTIHVEEGVTLDLGTAQNGRIFFNGTSGSLRLEGAGSYAFDGDSQNSLVNISNPQQNICVYTADATFTSRNAKGYLANGKLNIASGTYNNIGFLTNPEAIKGGKFSNTDFENYLPDGKMAVLSGGFYVIGDLTAASAKFRVDNPGMESLYYRTLGYQDGAFSSAQAGATITFLDDYHQEGAIGHLANNITIDLNSRTLDSLGGNPALPITDGNSITVRNGYLDVLKVVEEGMASYTLVGDNLRVNDSSDENHTHIYSEEFLARVNGVIVKDAEATTTIQTVAPQEYAAKIVRGTREFYFVGEHGVKYAMSKIKSGDTVYVHQYEEDAAGSLGQLDETLTIYKDSNVEDFPKVTSSVGKANPTITGDRCDYLVGLAPVCKVTIGNDVYNYMSLQDAVTDTTHSKNHTIEIAEDFDIASQVVIPAYAGTLTIDFCGHTVTVLGGANGHGGLQTYQRAFNVTAHNNKYDQDITFKNTTTKTGVNSGGVILEEANLIQNSKSGNATNMDVYIEGGVFRRQSSEGYISQFIQNYNTNNIHITGGIFRVDLFSNNPYNLLSKSVSPVFNVDNFDYYQVL